MHSTTWELLFDKHWLVRLFDAVFHYENYVGLYMMGLVYCATAPLRPKMVTIVLYSLRSKLLVAEMDVSSIKMHLDTSIPTTSNLERREYHI